MKLLKLVVFFVIQTTLSAQELTWPDPVANHVIPMQSTSVTHGPVLGNVTSDSVRVWVRAEREIQFEVLVRPHRPPFDDAAVTPAATIFAIRGQRFARCRMKPATFMSLTHRGVLTFRFLSEPASVNVHLVKRTAFIRTRPPLTRSGRGTVTVWRFTL